MLFQSAQSGPSGSNSFIQGFQWYGVHMPPSAPYVGPSPTYTSESSGGPNPC